MCAKSKKALKPTVFLSHSSSDRREMIALKHFLEGRAAGMIDFFLSSDDNSIEPGKIWPAEIRAALDRMQLMLIFVSAKALGTGWTYFEAGYGLHKLDTASIYCLPGTEKESLPTPFNLLQNRNLHSAKDTGLLIRHINQKIGAKLNDVVTKAEYERIFQKNLLGKVAGGPPLHDVVESVTVTTLGPHNSSELFEEAGKQLEFAVSKPARPIDPDCHERCSNGIRIAVVRPDLKRLKPEIEIDDEDRKKGHQEVIVEEDRWRSLRWSDLHSSENQTTKTTAEIEAYNEAVRARNAPLVLENEGIKRLPRRCTFTILPVEDLSPQTLILDEWLASSGNVEPLTVTIKLRQGVVFEALSEVVGARVYGTQLTLQPDSNLLWHDRVHVLVPHESAYMGSKIELKAKAGRHLKFSEFDVEGLMNLLCELKLISLPSKSRSYPRR